MEFRDNECPRNQKVCKVDIGTEWNLEEDNDEYWESVVSGRYRNRVEFRA